MEGYNPHEKESDEQGASRRPFERSVAWGRVGRKNNKRWVLAGTRTTYEEWCGRVKREVLVVGLGTRLGECLGGKIKQMFSDPASYGRLLSQVRKFKELGSIWIFWVLRG